MIEKIRKTRPDYKYGWLNPFCVGCGRLGAQIPTQLFIDMGAEYRCGACRDSNEYAAPKFILDVDRINALGEVGGG